MNTCPFPAGFFSQTASLVARGLVGHTVVCNVGAAPVSAIILETEAFEDGADGGSIRKGMLYGPGTVFVMNHRGHLYLNVGTEASGVASCVMVCSVLIGTELVEGPGRVSKRLGVTDAHDGRPLGTDLDLLANGLARPVVQQSLGTAKNSIGRFAASPLWVAHIRQILTSP